MIRPVCEDRLVGKRAGDPDDGFEGELSARQRVHAWDQDLVPAGGLVEVKGAAVGGDAICDSRRRALG